MIFFFAILRSKFESLDVRDENTECVRNTAPANETWFYVCFTYLPNRRKWHRFSSHLQKPVGRTSTPLSYQKNDPPLWKLYAINFTNIKNCTPVQCMFRTLPLTPWTYSLVRLREWSKTRKRENTKTRKRDSTKTRKRAKQERPFCRKQQKNTTFNRTSNQRRTEVGRTQKVFSFSGFLVSVAASFWPVRVFYVLSLYGQKSVWWS